MLNWAVTWGGAVRPALDEDTAALVEEGLSGRHKELRTEVGEGDADCNAFVPADCEEEEEETPT